MGIEGHLVHVASSPGPLVYMCLTDNRLNARPVMVVYLGFTGHRSLSRGPRMERKAMVLIMHVSSQLSVTELCRLMRVRACKLDKGWNYLCRWAA